MKAQFAALTILAVLAFGAVAEEAKPVDTTPKLATGLLMKQGDKLVFAPCRDRSYAVVDDVSSGAAVTGALKSVGLEAGKKLYVELFGVLEGIALKASGLNFARADGRCQPSGGPDEAWRASGEPGWTLAAGGEHLVVKRPGKPDAKFAFGAVKTEGGVTTYETSREANQLALRIERGVCRDKSAADVVFGWSATVNVNGESLKGCAWQR